MAQQVENCLTTKAVASEQYVEEIKTMKAYMLQQCPHLARWGLGSNKVTGVAVQEHTRQCPSITGPSVTTAGWCFAVAI